MIVKEFRELVRDRRTLGLLIMMPLLLLVIFGYAANFYVSSLRTAVVGPQAWRVAATLPPFFDVTVRQPSGTRADAETLLQDNKVDVAFVTGHAPVLALVNGSNLFAAQSAVAVLNKVGNKVKTQVLYNPGLKTSWVMVSAIVGLILTFICTIITSIGMVREREASTLELPLTYFTMISQGIMLRGAPITSLWLPFGVLAAMAAVVFTGATLRFRRDLAPGRSASPAAEQPAAAETVSTA
jgi:ABC-2 type transport system permease protein